MTTVLGGPHLTLMPEESIGPEHPEVDYVIQGEAEESIVEFVDALEGRRPMELVHGLYWRKNGEMSSTRRAGLVPNLDNIPYPAHDLFKITRYTNLQPLTDGLDTNARAYTIMTSRGCPYKCTYCSKPITGDTWRPRTVENVIGEWRWLVHDLRATEIGLTDDIWNLKLDRAKELCRRIIDEGLNTVPWVTVHGMKVNHGDAELFQLMKAAGCKRVGFGVESGDPTILRNVIKKSQSLDRCATRSAGHARPGCKRWGSSSSACRRRPKRRWRRRSSLRWSWTPIWRTSCWRRRIPAPRCTT